MAAVLVSAGVLVGGAAFGNPTSSSRPSPPPSVVSLDDGYKTPLVLHTHLAVPNGEESQANLGSAVPTGQRFVIETISISGSGSGPARQDQGIESVGVSDGTWTLTVPLDRYSWGSCPGTGNCTGVARYWKYGATQSVRAYADSGTQLTVSAWHPGLTDPANPTTPPTTEYLDIYALGYLVPLAK